MFRVRQFLLYESVLCVEVTKTVNEQFELSRNNGEWDLRVKLATYEGGITRKSRKIQGGSNMTGTDLCVNKPHCAAAVRP